MRKLLRNPRVTEREGRCWAVLPAAGIGARMGAPLPKQYLEVAGSTLLEHSLRALLSCSDIAAVCVALHSEDSRAASLPLLSDARVLTTSGAAQRSGSVLAGLRALAAVADECDWVLVHDAARPCVLGTDINRLIEAVQSSGSGGLLAQPIVDTVKQANAAGRVQATVDRQQLWCAQTPQMFRLGELRGALEAAERDGVAVTDEASAMEYAGYPVQLVEGGRHNLKVTVAADLALAEWYLRSAATVQH